MFKGHDIYSVNCITITWNYVYTRRYIFSSLYQLRTPWIISNSCVYKDQNQHRNYSIFFVKASISTQYP